MFYLHIYFVTEIETKIAVYKLPANRGAVSLVITAPMITPMLLFDLPNGQ